MDVPAAEILLGDVVPHRVLHDGRAGHEELRDVAHHHREVAEHGLGGADADHAAEQQVDDRHGGELLRVQGAAQVPGQERSAASPRRAACPASMAPVLSFALLSPSFFCCGTIAATLPPPDEPSSIRTEGARSSIERRSR